MRIDTINHLVSIQILLRTTTCERWNYEIVIAVTGAKCDVRITIVVTKKELLAKSELRRRMCMHIHETKKRN